MRRILVALAVLLTGCATGPDRQTALTSLPYEIRPSGRIVVATHINGQGPYRFAIDTAASGSFISPALASELGLSPIPDADARVFGAVATGQFPIVEVATLAVGDIGWNDLQLILLPAATSATIAIDGVLGIDLLRQYLIGFDVVERNVSLYPPDAPVNRNWRGWAPVPIQPVTFGNTQVPLYLLEMEVAGRNTPALFDLGTGISMLNPEAARYLELRPTNTDEQGEFAGAIGTEIVTARLSSQALRTASISWRNESFLISDPEIFTTLGFANEPFAILGSGLFLQRDFIIDFASERLLVRSSMREVN